MIIYFFKLCLFFIKEAATLSLIFAPLQETEHPDLQSEDPGFNDTEADRTGSPCTNIWNFLQFSGIRISVLTAGTYI